MNCLNHQSEQLLLFQVKSLVWLGLKRYSIICFQWQSLILNIRETNDPDYLAEFMLNGDDEAGIRIPQRNHFYLRKHAQFKVNEIEQSSRKKLYIKTDISI